VAFENDLPRIEGADFSTNNDCQRHVSNLFAAVSATATAALLVRPPIWIGRVQPQTTNSGHLSTTAEGCFGKRRSTASRVRREVPPKQRSRSRPPVRSVPDLVKLEIRASALESGVRQLLDYPSVAKAIVRSAALRRGKPLSVEHSVAAPECASMSSR
jgi:hypothetical protein